jgi:hypothetical protein
MWHPSRFVGPAGFTSSYTVPVNQTEVLLARARNDADRRLIEFGHDPWLVEWFLTLTPSQRLRYVQDIARVSLKRRAELGIG